MLYGDFSWRYFNWLIFSFEWILSFKIYLSVEKTAPATLEKYLFCILFVVVSDTQMCNNAASGSPGRYSHLEIYLISHFLLHNSKTAKMLSRNGI